MDKSKRWKFIVGLILTVTIGVNIYFGWLAIMDEGGGFELVVSDDNDSSYKIKVPLEETSKRD